MTAAMASLTRSPSRERRRPGAVVVVVCESELIRRTQILLERKALRTSGMLTTGDAAEAAIAVAEVVEEEVVGTEIITKVEATTGVAMVVTRDGVTTEEAMVATMAGVTTEEAETGSTRGVVITEEGEVEAVAATMVVAAMAATNGEEDVVGTIRGLQEIHLLTRSASRHIIRSNSSSNLLKNCDSLKQIMIM